MTRIMIADDHPIVVSGLEMLLKKSGYDVVACVANGAEALDAMDRVDPDILILDVQMPEQSGLDVLDEMRRRGDNRAVVLLTAGVDDRQAAQAIGHGVKGLVLKDGAPDLLLHCLTEVKNGGSWIDPGIDERAHERAKTNGRDGDAMDALSARERAVVDLVVKGLRNREIANRLGIAEGTVKVHLHKVYEKLGVSSRTELVIYARDLAGT